MLICRSDCPPLLKFIYIICGVYLKVDQQNLRPKRLLIILVLFIISGNALAWGPSGHHIVCDIAWRSLNPALREKMSAVANRMGYRTFAQSCVWADRIRSNPQFYSLNTLHYINVPKAAKSVNRPRDCPNSKKPDCVLTAISYYQQRWQDSNLNQQQRDQALLLLAHFVGDIHQPMHVSYQFDYGGNRRMIGWKNNRQLSLHRLWDDTIIHCDKKTHWRKRGRQLYAKITPLQRQQWQKLTTNQALTIDQWANESLALTRKIYAYLNKSWEPSGYCQQFMSIAQQRLQMAGVRLALLLHN